MPEALSGKTGLARLDATLTRLNAEFDELDRIVRKDAEELHDMDKRLLKNEFMVEQMAPKVDTLYAAHVASSAVSEGLEKRERRQREEEEIRLDRANWKLAVVTGLISAVGGALGIVVILIGFLRWGPP